jgi:integrase/recombinase XerD
MDARGSRDWRRKPLAAGTFQPEISSFRLALAAEAKAAKTVRMYTEAVRWFAAAHLIPQTGWTRWDQVTARDVQWWMVWLLSRYSDSYASNQYRALQQFFRWWAEEEELPSPMARLRPPKVTDKLIPVFTSVELSKLEQACQGRSFMQRRDAAIIAVFQATGIRLFEVAGIRYDADDTQRSDLDLWQREITVCGKQRQAAHRQDQLPGGPHPRPVYPRSRAARPGLRPQLWLGVNNRGPMTAHGIYQMIVRRGQQCGVKVHPHRFRHHFSHTWLDRGGAAGDLMELNGWPHPRCCAATAPAPAAPAAPMTAL